MINNISLLRPLKYAYFISIALILPIQQVSLPFNTLIFDYVNAAFIGIFLIYFLVNRTLEIRLTIPWLVILTASLISMINSAGVALNLLTLAQELYLWIFFIVVSNVIREEREMRVLAGLLFFGAAVYSIPLLQELAANFTGRAVGLFTDDNGGAGYLGVMAFLVYYPFSKIWRLLKPVFLALILGGVFATKSLSGALSYLTGSAAIFVWYWRSVEGKARARLTVLGIGFAILLIAGYHQASQLHNYLDRLPNSEGGRKSIWAAGLNSFAHNPLGIGIGPARFKEAVIVPEWSYRKELHSDYLSFLAERGILGFVGLMLIFGAIARSWSRCLRNATSQPELVWIMGLLGMLVFTLVDAISHETLHNRQLWVVYAMIVAQERISTKLKRKTAESPPAGLPGREAQARIGTPAAI